MTVLMTQPMQNNTISPVQATRLRYWHQFERFAGTGWTHIRGSSKCGSNGRCNCGSKRYRLGHHDAVWSGVLTLANGDSLVTRVSYADSEALYKLSTKPRIKETDTLTVALEYRAELNRLVPGMEG